MAIERDRLWRLAEAASQIAVIVALVIAGGVFVTQPAWAHEFPLTLATALDPATSSVVAADRLAGFRLAVDQSPDVSHPPGEEGGDHLGGIDVAIEVMEFGPPRTSATPAGLGDHRGVAVVIGSHDALSSWAAGTYDFDLVIAVQTTAGEGIVLRGPSVTLVPLSDPGSTTPAADEFARSYAQAFGASPTLDAGRGHDAGVMVDAVVGVMGTDTSDASVLAATAEAAADRLTSSRVAATMASPQGPATGDEARSRWPTAVAIVLVAVASGALIMRRRRPT